MTSEEWGPWIDHDGKGCPIPRGTMFQAETEDRGVLAAEICKGGRSWNWAFRNQFDPVIRYRVRKPRGMTVLEEALREIETPEGVNA